MHVLIDPEGVFSNLLPRFESCIFVVNFVQSKSSYGEAQASNAFIQSTDYFSSFSLLFFCQIPIKEAQMWPNFCRGHEITFHSVFVI